MMIVVGVQRWRSRRTSYRPVGELLRIDPRAYDVAPITDDTTAKAFIAEHHYERSYPSARARFGLYRGERLVGVAVFSCPVNPLSLDPAPGDNDSRAELGRLVLLDCVPANGETWMLARCFEQLRRDGYTGITSFSDPHPRTAVDGRLVFPGHVGTIYQAHNAVYIGQSKPDRKRLLPDGTVIPNRALTKIRHRQRGWEYAAAILERHGAEPLGERDDPIAWLERWLPAITRSMRHPGNHKYAWALRSRDRRHMPTSAPYPKITQLELIQ